MNSGDTMLIYLSVGFLPRFFLAKPAAQCPLGPVDSIIIVAEESLLQAVAPLRHMMGDSPEARLLLFGPRSDPSALGFSRQEKKYGFPGITDWDE
jgi:hypothetical protein